ncbi:MAG TPA: universal stress protein [Catenuloplanes sp.]
MGTMHTAPVVVGVNGTAASRAAVRLAAREAAMRQRPLRAVHAFVWPFYDSAAPERPYGLLRQQAADPLAGAVAAARTTEPGLPVSGHLVDQPATAALLRASRTAALLVLGAEDLADRIGLPVESVLVQLVARARCPVLVAGPTQPQGGPVVVGVDGSPAAQLAVDFAFDEATRRKVPLVAVHAWESGDQDAARRLLDDAVDAWRDKYAAVEVERQAVRGDVADVLLERALDAQLLVVGPRGAGAGFRTLLGSAGQALLRRSRCPTVFVRAPAQATTTRR